MTISTAVDSVGYCGLPQYNKEIIVNVLDFSKDMDLLVNSLDPAWQQTQTPWTYYYNNEPVTEIPEGITSIGKYQFCAYNQASSITIPSSVTKIGVHAFSSNNGIRSSITSITCLATEPPTFEGSYLYNVTLYVLPGCKSAYENSKGWNTTFANIVEDETLTAITTPTVQSQSVMYDLSGRRLAEPHKGIVIKNGKKIFVK